MNLRDRRKTRTAHGFDPAPFATFQTMCYREYDVPHGWLQNPGGFVLQKDVNGQPVPYSGAWQAFQVEQLTKKDEAKPEPASTRIGVWYRPL